MLWGEVSEENRTPQSATWEAAATAGSEREEDKVAGDSWLLLRLRKVSPTRGEKISTSFFLIIIEETPQDRAIVRSRCRAGHANSLT